MLLEGLGESTAPGILGFSRLSMTALLLAVGALRTEPDGAVRASGTES